MSSATVNTLLKTLETDYDDAALRNACLDAMQEDGMTEARARNVVEAYVRVGKLNAARALVEKCATLRWHIRDAVHGKAELEVDVSRYPVEVVSGCTRPKAYGEGPYHTWRGSDSRVHNAAGAIRAGYRLDYHKSTRRVVVGSQWVLHLAKKLGIGGGK